MILYENGNVILEDRILKNANVLVKDNFIINIYEGKKEEINTRRIDCKDKYISPGFIDTHLHGGAGFDVMDATKESLTGIAKTHHQFGMTSFLPTTLTNSIENIKKAVRNIYDVMNSDYEGARILGVHLEGPCFSMKFKGAQNPKYLANPSIELFKDLGQGLEIIKRVSMAPELEGAFETAEYLAGKGINVSVGHSNADFSTVLEATKHGFSHITHMYNGMSFLSSPDYYCKTGVAEAGLLLDTLTAEIIADGKHMPPELIKLLYKNKGADRMLLTTDATRPTNLGEGSYELGGLPVIVTDGVAMLADRTSFAGSVATCDRLLRFAHFECGIPLHEAVKMIGLNHSKLVNMDDEIGSIKVGKRADIILLDKELFVK
jgi:N-acetylglucosamine-6-phosphate deacetylase